MDRYQIIDLATGRKVNAILWDGLSEWHPGEGYRVEPDDPDRPIWTPPAEIAPISDRQFAQALALAHVITEDEALAWAARGDLPARLSTAIASLPVEQRFPARMLLSSATTYERDHPLVPALGATLGYDTAALDALWVSAAAL